ncbi:MAG: DAK2 domain-containing protein [Bacteroides sp.]|nr:DAK2 domain-containing protein [Bacillota bacterium]MCM1394320.1 DAK2 domain-containing protein [[Eubacterium] siraeum]MCM1455667.1 DAK2 domain-containing protein [Bacteroides sp.]
MIKIDGSKFKEMLAGGARALELNRDTVDALNVFPVPDGDTGTNMSLTVASALREANACDSVHVGEIATAFSRGALKGARGNSGVITSQIFKGFSLALDGKTEITVKSFAECLKRGTEIAYSAVTKPKEGTILTVIRQMAETAASASRGKKVEMVDFLKKVIDAGEEILQKTPEMLPVLKKAGVVDAGGRGILTVFDGMYRTLAGLDLVLISGESVKFDKLDDAQTSSNKEFDTLENDYENITFQYCTEFFITHLKNDVTDASIDKFRNYLMTIGDCVLVIGDTDLVKTHVHTNNPDRALKSALNLGELDGVKIENMLEQYRKIHAGDAAGSEVELKENAVISVCCGEGLAAIFKDLMVDVVVEGGQTMNPSVDAILTAITNAQAKNVYILPNNSNIILAANQAKELAKPNVFVIPTTNMPEGISAMLAYDLEADGVTNYDNMCATLGSTCVAEITHAVRNTRMNGFSVKEGDIIGINNKKIVAKNQSVAQAAISTIKKIAQNKDMVTLYYGEGVSQEDAEALVQSVSSELPDIEVACYFGGQPHYFYIISAE